MIFKRHLRLCVLFALLSFVHVLGLKAQTHAEATSQKWKGIKVEDVLGNDTYKFR